MNGYHIEEDNQGYDWYIQAGAWIAMVSDYKVISCENGILVLKHRENLNYNLIRYVVYKNGSLIKKQQK